MDAYFCQGEINKPVYDRIFSYHTLLKTHSNQEHDNANLHPPNPESVEQLVEQIIHYVPVWIISNWECVLHVYFFMDEFLEEIMDVNPLLLFVW